MPRRDRDGSVIGEDVVDPAEVAHRCRDGWLSTPDDDRPRPCPQCKPWLTRHPPRPPTAAEREQLRTRTTPPPRPTPDPEGPP